MRSQPARSRNRQPVYDSSCSMRERTQSNSPLVTLTRQYSQLPTWLTLSGAPQFGQFASPYGAPLRCVPRTSVQYSE